MTQVRVDINQVEEGQIRSAASGLGHVRQRIEGVVAMIGHICKLDSQLIHHSE